MAQEDQSSKNLDLLNQSIDNPNVPKIYINGFFIGTSNADVTVVAQGNGRPVAVLNLSFEIAKTLVMKLNGVVASLEKAADVSFLTTDDIDKVASKIADK